MMRVLMILLACLACGVAAAQDTRLQSLDTSEAGRGWDAVGRIDIDGRGFCTGTLIEPDLVLTAAHCLYDRDGLRIEPARLQFLAGWRNGRASAYRDVRRAVTLPDYAFKGPVDADRVRNDVALLELSQPIRNPSVRPFRTAERPRDGERIGVVSYALDRAEAPSLQETCVVRARQQGILVMSCSINYGSSGAPVFSFETGEPQIVSVVSAMAQVEGQQVSLGTALGASLDVLRAQLAADTGRIAVGGVRRDTGAKFVKP